MAASKRTSISNAVLAERRPKAESPPWPGAVPSRAELASAFSQALDLAEGRRLGHAARVSYIALNLAQVLELPAELQQAAFYAALLHDAGAAPASAEVCRLVNLTEEALFRADPDRSPHQLALEIAPSNATAVVDVLHAHPERGAQVARELGFDRAVQEAITSHHERWDGQGYPQALEGAAIPIAGRLIAVADVIDSVISTDPSPLVARRSLLPTIAEHAGGALDPELVQQARRLSGDDAFWLGLYSHDLNRALATLGPKTSPQEERSLAHLHAFASVFSTLADGKGEHTARHGERTADLATRLGEALGFSEGRREMLRIAGLVHDIGLLGIPARVIAKPDILSLTEMELMRKHPSYSQMVLEDVPGLEEVTHWVGAHHERPDGKGYPEMMEDETIPLEARIIAVADTYVALTSTRPYRRALSHEDAQQVLLGGAGTQLDVKLVKLLCSLAPEPTSSRTAPRSRRKR
ncbi:MAG: HD domain-containing protein [Chloroflexi bacterium]|nr:HD domain-containing protein [Chloroflexota bacterium]